MFERIKRFFVRESSSSTAPTVPLPFFFSIQTRRDLWDRLASASNYMEQYRIIYLSDPVVFAAVQKMGTLVAQAFRGFDGWDPPFDANALIESAAKQVLVFGNSLWIKPQTEGGKPKPLPIEVMSAVENREQIANISDSDMIIRKAAFYVANEWDPDSRKVYPAGFVIHFKFDPTPTLIEDIYGRKTFGVWSPSPLMPLIPVAMWKHQAIDTDIAWRMVNLPREHHKLKVPVDPSMFSGDAASRYQAAQQMVQQIVSGYIQGLQRRRPDQGYVTTDAVEIKYVEPKTAGYKDPNELLEQLNTLILSSLMINPSAVYGKGASSYASELIVKGYTALMAEQIATELARTLARAYGVDAEPIIGLELDIDKSEKARQVLLLVNAGVITYNEARRLLGLPPIEGGDVLVKKGGPGRPYGHPEPENVVKKDPGRITHPLTPQSKRVKEND